ncbi:MAG: Hpt domain-containing protein [Bacteroidota bacterium]
MSNAKRLRHLAVSLMIMVVNINLEYADTLSDGDQEFKVEFTNTFENSFRELTKEMYNNLASRDFAQLAKNAHQLKPSAKMIELPCAMLLEEIQHDPHTGTIEKLDQIVEECEDALRQLRAWENK